MLHEVLKAKCYHCPILLSSLQSDVSCFIKNHNKLISQIYVNHRNILKNNILQQQASCIYTKALDEMQRSTPLRCKIHLMTVIMTLQRTASRPKTN